MARGAPAAPGGRAELSGCCCALPAPPKGTQNVPGARGHRAGWGSIGGNRRQEAVSAGGRGQRVLVQPPCSPHGVPGVPALTGSWCPEVGMAWGCWSCVGWPSGTWVLRRGTWLPQKLRGALQDGTSPPGSGDLWGCLGSSEGAGQGMQRASQPCLQSLPEANIHSPQRQAPSAAQPGRSPAPGAPFCGSCTFQQDPPVPELLVLHHEVPQEAVEAGPGWGFLRQELPLGWGAAWPPGARPARPARLCPRPRGGPQHLPAPRGQRGQAELLAQGEVLQLQGPDLFLQALQQLLPGDLGAPRGGSGRVPAAGPSILPLPAALPCWPRVWW